MTETDLAESAPKMYMTDTRPRWRWQRAVALATRDRGRLRRTDDKLVHRAFQFLQALRRAGPHEPARQHVADRFPATSAAYDIFRGGGRLRDAIEALLLAAESIAGIAEFTAVPPQVVQRYADLWFDLGEDRLLSRSAGHPRIALSLIPEIYEAGFETDNVEPYWKGLAPTDAFEVILADINRTFQVGEEPDLAAINTHMMRGAARLAADGRLDLKALSRTLVALEELRRTRDSGLVELEMLHKALYQVFLEDAPWRFAMPEDFAGEESMDDVKRANGVREEQESKQEAGTDS